MAPPGNVGSRRFCYDSDTPPWTTTRSTRPTSDDPWWQETAWFTFVVPERRLTCYVYPWVKANQGILGGGVMVWDDRGRHPWDAVHWDYQWTYPYPTPR